MKPKFSSLPKPILVASLRQESLSAVEADMEKAEQAGAQAFILHMQLLREDARSFAALQAMAKGTNCPILAICYQAAGFESHDFRADLLCQAAAAGFAAADVPMDLFDENPAKSLVSCGKAFAKALPCEVSMEEKAIEKQKALLALLRDLGAETLFSAHVQVHLTEEQAVSLALEMQDRGADMAKIVSACQTKAEALEVLQGNLALAAALQIPFLYTSTGTHTRFVRFNAPLFGSMLAFGHESYAPLSNRQKPLLSDLAAYYTAWEKNT